MKKWEIIPQFIQVEAHPYFTQKEIRKEIRKNSCTDYFKMAYTDGLCGDSGK